MKAKELLELSRNDLVAKEKELAEELFKLKFQHGIRAVANPARMQQIKKDIARVNTVLGTRVRQG